MQILLFDEGAFRGLGNLGTAFVDGLDGRGDDRSAVSGMVEFEAHAAAHKARLQHGASPGGADDGDGNRARTEFRMSPEQGAVIAQEYGGITMMLGLDEQDRARLQVVEENPAFDFRLHNIVVNLVAQIRMRLEHRQFEVSVHEAHPLLLDDCIIHP